MDVVLLGPPGAGKGTQAKRLSARLKVPHIASGDLFRAIRQEDTALACEVRVYMDSGRYVPDELTIRLVLERLHKPDAASGFILDGFPRTEPQAEALDQELGKNQRQVDVVLYITAPTDVLLGRVATRLICPNCGSIFNLNSRPPTADDICDVCGHKLERRTDEDPQVVRVRLETYIAQTTPLVQYYKKHNVLHEIDGSRPVSDVESEVDAALSQKSLL